MGSVREPVAKSIYTNLKLIISKDRKLRPPTANNPHKPSNRLI